MDQPLAFLVALLAMVAWGSVARAASPETVAPEAMRLTDEELARVTGKFLLPNGTELALTVTSDTVVNGQPVLRTVLTVDNAAQLQVFGRSAAAGGETALTAVPGGPAIATADGVVSLQSVRGGTQVTFSGDQLSVVNLVGHAVVTAITNSANDRVIDSTTNVAIDARNLAPYQAAMAQMRVEALAIQAARGLGR